MEIRWTTLERVLNEFADTFIQNARDGLQADGSIATGELYDSFEKIIEIGEDYYSVKISLADYWQYVNNGRKPGKFPPPPAIRNWIEVKPVNPYPLQNGKTPSIEQLTFLIGRKIANEGIEPTNFFDEAKEQTIRDFEQRIDLAIAEDVSNYILNIVETGMKNALG